jgi:hypothetical protein
LSFGNLDRFRAEPLDTFIKIKGDEIGMPFDVLLFSGRTEKDIADRMMKGISKDTIIRIDKGFKS